MTTQLTAQYNPSIDHFYQNILQYNLQSVSIDTTQMQMQMQIKASNVGDTYL